MNEGQIGKLEISHRINSANNIVQLSNCEW